MDTVLIVDDSSFIVEGLIAFLKKKYLPLAAYGGAECLELLRRETPSVIILDIMMEPMDGWETLGHIKENPETRHIPVIMFSAMKISPAEAASHQISIDDCLTKPISPGKIIEAIEKVLARRDTNRVVIERWQSAGISQDRIDEYLSLITSLEMDISLCQNMKIQYDLGHPKDKNEDEFEAIIKAVEERILQERDLIEKLAREINDAMEAIPVNAGTDAAPEPGSRPKNPAPAADARPGIAGSVPEVPSPDERIPIEPSALPVESAPSADAPEIPLPATDILPGNEAAPEKSGTSPASGSPGSESGGADTVSVQKPEPGTSAEGSSPPALPASDLHVTEKRNVIPADPDVPPARSGTAAVTGAGTDVPMPWNHLQERTPQRVITEMEKKTGILAPDPVTQPRGIFARIISIVRSFFGRGK